MKLALATLVASCALGWLASPAHATDRHWTGAASVYWNDAGNWNPAGTPANGDNLFFDASGANKSMVNNLPNLAVGSLAFISDDTPYPLDGNTLTVNSQFWTDPSQSNVVTLKCPLHFPTSATVTACAEAAGPGETKADLYLDGPITIDSGQVTIEAQAQNGASGSESGHISILGPISGAGNLLVEADEDSGIKGSVEFDEDPFLVTQDGSLTGTFALRTEGNAEIILHQADGQSMNPMVSVLNGDTANIRLWPLNQEGSTFNGGTVETGYGQFGIGRPVTVNPSSAATLINGNLNLPAGDARVFEVSDGAADPDLLVNADISGTPTYFVKQGTGTMRLASANTFFATNLSATNWFALSPSPVVIGTDNVVTNAIGSQQRLYPLSNP